MINLELLEIQNSNLQKKLPPKLPKSNNLEFPTHLSHLFYNNIIQTIISKNQIYSNVIFVEKGLFLEHNFFHIFSLFMFAEVYLHLNSTLRYRRKLRIIGKEKV